MAKKPEDVYVLAYYQVQLKGATLYLHTLVRGKDAAEAASKFFTQEERWFGDVRLLTKGTIGPAVPVSKIPAKWAKMLHEVGGGINTLNLKSS